MFVGLIIYIKEKKKTKNLENNKYNNHFENASSIRFRCH